MMYATSRGPLARFTILMVTERLLTPMTIFYEAKKMNTKLQVLKVW